MSATAVLQAPLINTPSENWDDDFEFGASGSTPADAAHLAADAHRAPRKRPSVALSETENWDDDYLNDDAQPGPSTQRRPSHSPRHSKGSTRTTTENWDDDFEDKSAAASPTRAAEWDSDDDRNQAPKQASSHQLPSHQTSHRIEASFSSDEEDHAEFGLHVPHDDDKTVTSSTRNRPFTMESVPEVPPLFNTSRLSPTHPSPLPASPTLSSFSATLSYAPSHYSSTAHLALRPTLSAGSSIDAQGRAFPTSQPGVLRKPPPAASNNATRARRRLRKKSRPSRVDADIFELDDRGANYEMNDEEARAARLARLAEHVSGMTSTETDLDEEPDEDDAGYIPPVTPEPRGYYQASSRPQSAASNVPHAYPNHSVVSFAPGSTPSSAIPVPAGTPSSSAGPSSSPVRSPILSRLGSVKRWATGARRLSNAPSDTSPSGGDLEYSPASRPASIAFAQQRERARSPLGEPLNPTVHELQPLGSSALQSKKSTNTLHQDENSKNKSWFFRNDGGGPLRGRKSRDHIKDPPGGNTTSASADLEQCPPNLLGAVFPRRESDAGLESEEKEHPQAKERRGILGLRRISLLGSHKRQRSGAEGSIAPASPAEASFSGQLAGYSFPPEQRSPTDPNHLPPIALSPPSPPRTAKIVSKTLSEPVVQANASPSSIKFAATSQAASLGRNGTPTLEAQREISLRRNSLGDLKTLDGGLKIPARISRAQVGLKRDLGLVREFATCVDQLKQLQQAYLLLLGELRILLETPASPTSGSSSSTRLFHLPRAPLARPTEGEHARRLQHIEHEYSIWWECAEVLIELGGTGATGPAASVSEPKHMGTSDDTDRERTTGKRRERAVTLLGGEAPSTPTSNGPPPASPPGHWRASTGRHDLSHRQLVLLKQMLNTPDPATFVVGNIVAVTNGRRREPSGTVSAADVSFASAPGNSTSSESRIGLGLQLPDVDTRMLASSPVPSQGPSSPQNKRGSRGITGLRELLRSFKRHGTAASSSVSNAATSRSDLPHTGSATTSSASVSQDEPKATARQRKPRSSTGAQTVVSEQEKRRKREVHPNSPYGTVGAVPTAKTPRRPSLASLFRLAGSKSKVARQPSQTETRNSEEADYSDWDRMESASDLDLPNGIVVPAIPETIRGSKRSRYSALQATPPATVRRARSRSASRTRGASASRSSVNLAAPSTPSPSKAKALHNRVFRSSRPASRDGNPPPAPSHGLAQALANAGGSSSAAPTQDTDHHRPQTRERSSTTPSRRPAGSRSVSANYVPQAPHTDPLPPMPDAKVALTPENLGPLLEYAREVSARLGECVTELRTVLGPRNSPTPDIGVGSAPS